MTELSQIFEQIDILDKVLHFLDLNDLLRLLRLNKTVQEITGHSRVWITFLTKADNTDPEKIFKTLTSFPELELYGQIRPYYGKHYYLYYVQRWLRFPLFNVSNPKLFENKDFIQIIACNDIVCNDTEENQFMRQVLSKISKYLLNNFPGKIDLKYVYMHISQAENGTVKSRVLIKVKDVFYELYPISFNDKATNYTQYSKSHYQKFRHMRISCLDKHGVSLIKKNFDTYLNITYLNPSDNEKHVKIISEETKIDGKMLCDTITDLWFAVWKRLI